MSFAIIDHGPAQPPAPTQEQAVTEALRVSMHVAHATDVVISEAAQRVATAVLNGVHLREQLEQVELSAMERGRMLSPLAGYGVPTAFLLVAAAVVGSGLMAAAALCGPGVAHMVHRPRLRNDHEVGPDVLAHVKRQYAMAVDPGQPPYVIEAARHGVIMALETARRQRGLCAEAELWLQDLKFAKATDAAADATGARIAQAADALYVNRRRESPSCELVGLDPYEVVALQNRLSHREPGRAVSWIMNKAVDKAFIAIASAQARAGARR